MAKYINKSALIAEIEKLKSNLIYGACASQISMETRCKEEAYNDVLSFINTLEVKEVDLEKEVKEEYLNRRCYVGKDNMLVILNEPQFNDVAKHFFELGLNAQQKISYVPNIDDILKKEGLDPDSKEAKIFKESYYTAMEKLKAQKGE